MFHVLLDVRKCDVLVCFDVCGVFVVIECCLLLLSRCSMICERMCGMS